MRAPSTNSPWTPGTLHRPVPAARRAGRWPRANPPAETYCFRGCAREDTGGRHVLYRRPVAVVSVGVAGQSS